MEINNFEIIKDFLNFNSSETFYIIQIIKRRKDPGNHDMNTNSKVKDTYIVDSIESYNECIPSIIDVCSRKNARAYINLNRRDYEQIAYQTLKAVTNYIISKEYKCVRNVYLTTCGRHSSEPCKKWIIDLDDKKFFEETHAELKKLEEEDEYKNKNQKDGKLIYYGYVPTRNGYHFIVSACNPKKYESILSKTNSNIHKDNPTLLYSSKMD